MIAKLNTLLESTILEPTETIRYSETLEEKKKRYGDIIKKNKEKINDLKNKDSEYFKDQIQHLPSIPAVRARLLRKNAIFQQKIDNDFRKVLV